MPQDLPTLALSVLNVSRNTLSIHLRFMNLAISRLRWLSIPDAVQEMPMLQPLLDETVLATEGTTIFYDPMALCKLYAADKNNGPRAYMHLILHGVFRHFEVKPSVLHPLWDLACDMAVEGVINDLNLPMLTNAQAAGQVQVLQQIAPRVNNLLTAEKIYAYLRMNPPSETEFTRLKRLFSPDNHALWYTPTARVAMAEEQAAGDNGGGTSGTSQRGQPNDGQPDDDRPNDGQPNDGQQDDAQQDDGQPNDGQPNDGQQEDASTAQAQAALSALLQDWQHIAEQMQTDLETFHKQRGDEAGGMMQNLRAVNREKYDYTAFLKKFAVMGEAMRINDDEFDYVFYSYGMQLFPEKRMPLIEPLEYKDVKHIREFVIAIDTSGSVMGEQVQAFLQKTYNILQSTESFFSRINIHIIQCDEDIQEDIKITSREEFDHYLQTMAIKGLGGTDFRPVFQRVDEMIRDGEFANLKGLIYFTDGYGLFPERMPAYKTAFVFVEDGCEIPEVPVWAMKLVLTREEVEEMAESTNK